MIQPVTSPQWSTRATSIRIGRKISLIVLAKKEIEFQPARIKWLNVMPLNVVRVFSRVEQGLNSMASEWNIFTDTIFIKYVKIHLFLCVNLFATSLPSVWVARLWSNKNTPQPTAHSDNPIAYFWTWITPASVSLEHKSLWPFHREKYFLAESKTKRYPPSQKKLSFHPTKIPGFNKYSPNIKICTKVFPQGKIALEIWWFFYVNPSPYFIASLSTWGIKSPETVGYFDYIVIILLRF